MLEMGAHLGDPISSPSSRYLGKPSEIKGNAPYLALDNVSINHPNSAEIVSWIQRSQTEVLLVQQNGEVVFEYYADNSDKGLKLNAFSMTKAITSLLIGIAIDDQVIASENDSITLYIPEIALEEDDEVTLKHMMQQISGMRDSLPFMLNTLGGKPVENLSELSFGLDKEFTYSNINYYLLAEVLQRVYQMPLNEIFEQKLWQPMELEQSLIINSTGYCCLFATAKTWLALGQLFLDKGYYNDKQIVSASWIDQMVNEKIEPPLFAVQATSKSRGNFYAYHIFSGLDDYPEYYWLEGMGLQLVMINPDKQTIIVRLGDLPSFMDSGSTREDKNLVEGLLRQF
jgi:CubicO group peptidase (beta-lactamase class C family)